MSSRRLIIALVGAFLVAACGGAAGEMNQGSATPGRSDAVLGGPSSPAIVPSPGQSAFVIVPLPAQSASASSGPMSSNPRETALPSASAVPTPQSTVGLSPLERSDLFWEALALGAEGQPQWATLDEVVEVSDLVVRGRVTDIRPGRTVSVPEIQFVLTTVAIEEVMKGEPETVAEGTIVIEWWLDNDAELADVRTQIPQHEALFVLFNQGLIAERAGHPEDIELYRFQYTEINGAQGTLRDIDGTTRSIFDEGGDWFPEGFDGGSYRDLLRQVRLAAGR